MAFVARSNGQGALCSKAWRGRRGTRREGLLGTDGVRIGKSKPDSRQSALPLLSIPPFHPLHFPPPLPIFPGFFPPGLHYRAAHSSQAIPHPISPKDSAPSAPSVQILRLVRALISRPCFSNRILFPGRGRRGLRRLRGTGGRGARRKMQHRQHRPDRLRLLEEFLRCQSARAYSGRRHGFSNSMNCGQTWRLVVPWMRRRAQRLFQW